MSSPTPSTPGSLVTDRFRLVVCCLVLTAVAFAQRPGRLVSDTKLDLVVDPQALLARALHLWDPSGSFGQIQNQAYGYLFPMGPFYWLGDLLSVPGWATQRLWWAGLLIVAFLGFVVLCRALGLGSQHAAIIGGFAYALSPRILTTLGPISVEAWPSALAPWVLVPLVAGCDRLSPRMAAALSAIAVGLVGGVNAAATFAVVPLGALWILTREQGPRRRTLLIWWPVLVAAACAWWLVPLLLLGRYSPPFLDYIETSAVTTVPTTLFDVVRGTSHWVPYVDRSWQAGNDLISNGYSALNSGVLLLLGVVGLMLRTNAHRTFLVLGVLTGVAMVTVGHGGATPGWFAGPEREALDGLLAPFRNVHKFDPVLRLPLTLGLAHVLAVTATRARESMPTTASWRERLSDGQRVAAVGVTVLSVVAVAGAASPALAGRLAPTGDFSSIPPYWDRTVDWLEENSGAATGTTALLVPGSSFATYLWGTPEDEPVQALGAPRWAVRNAVPLAPPGNIRMLSAIEARLAAGQPSAGLAPFLARAGIEHLVVRNDLSPSSDVPLPVLVHQAIEGSPGLVRVASFGPEIGGPVRIENRENDRDAERHESARRVVVEGGWHAEYPAVEVYAVRGADGAAATANPPLVIGGPESLLDLLDAGVIGDEPTVLAVDHGEASIPEGPLMLTDGLRRRETSFARVHDGSSATMSDRNEGRLGAAVRDYLPEGSRRWETTARLIGARDLLASSSRAFADTRGPVRPDTLPFAAFDGLASTAWESGQPRPGEPPWIEVRFDDPRVVPSVALVAAEVEGHAGPRVRVETAVGTSALQVLRPGQPVTVELSAGETEWLRVRMSPGADEPGELSLAEVQIPGVDIDRTLVLPEVPPQWGAPDDVVLAAGPTRDGCVEVDGDVRCAPDRATQDEEGGVLDRTLRLGTGASYRVTAAARPVMGDALLGLIQRDQLLNARASSNAVDDSRASAVAAVDGDAGTAWLADPDDPEPTLSLNWLGERRVSGVRLLLDRQTAAAPATEVEVSYPGGRQVLTLDAAGRAQMDPVRTTQLHIRVVDSADAVSRLGDGSTERLGVGVSEVVVEGLPLLPIHLPEIPAEIGCGFGPPLRVGDQLYATTVTASARQLFDGDPVEARVCGPATIDVPAGETRVVITPAPAFRPIRVEMTRPHEAPAAAAGSGSSASVRLTSPVDRTLTFDPVEREQLVIMRENHNPAWRASQPDGTPVPAAIADGWQQAWWAPARADELHAEFAPDMTYRLGLASGGAVLVLLIGVTSGLALRRRRVSSELPRCGPRPIAPWAVLAAGLIVLGLAAGWWGVAGGVAGAVITLGVRGRVSAAVAAWGSGLPLAAAATVYWLRPLGSTDGWAGALVAPQVLVALTLGALVAADVDLPRPRLRRRWLGRSTSR